MTTSRVSVISHNRLSVNSKRKLSEAELDVDASESRASKVIVVQDTSSQRKVKAVSMPKKDRKFSKAPSNNNNRAHTCPLGRDSCREAPVLASLLAGKVVGKQFQLVQILGEGSYGFVYLAQSIKDSSYVAVKVMAKSQNQKHLQLQQLEADIHASLQHVNVVKVEHVFQDGLFFYLVMELCEQGDLYDYLRRGSSRNEATIKNMFGQVLDAVEHLHASNVYHCDIKPENILLKGATERQQDTTCKLADFGFATREHYSEVYGCGTTAYMAPEHLDENKQSVPCDAAASDVWSLGIVLREMMFGRCPWLEASFIDCAFVLFEANPASLKDYLFSKMSSAACRLLTGMLALDAADRPSVCEIKKQFEAIEHLYETGEEGQAQL